MEEAELIVTEDGQFRWVRRARNGETIGASTEFYKRRIDAVRNYFKVNGGDEAPPLVERKVLENPA